MSAFGGKADVTRRPHPGRVTSPPPRHSKPLRLSGRGCQATLSCRTTLREVGPRDHARTFSIETTAGKVRALGAVHRHGAIETTMDRIFRVEFLVQIVIIVISVTTIGNTGIFYRIPPAG